MILFFQIVTGLYAESHGFVGNTMYDRIYNSFFQVEGGPDNFKSFWWNQSEPLWITAEKNGIRTAVYFWDGCQVEISGTRVTKCVKNNDFKEWSSNFTDFRAHNRDYNQTVDEIIQRFQSDDWGLAMIYYPVIDELAHHFGTRHERTVRSIKVFDKLIHRILNKLKMTSMEQRVNLIVLSDHGMLDHSTETKHISLDDYIDYDDIEVSASEMGRVISLYVKPSRESKVMQNLKNAKLSRQIKIFSKSEIPPGYHYRNHYRIADILLIAKDANFIRNFKQETSFPPVNDVYYADHGWDFYEHPQEMKAFMTAIGPGFKKGFFSEPLIMTDHYNIFCHLLKINANPNNGSFEKISPFLTDDNCYFDTCGKSDDLIPREKCCDYC